LLAPGSEGAYGIITSASIHIHALPAKTEYRRYLFNDFAGGLTALREAQHQALVHAGALLWDASETRFHHEMDQMGRHHTAWEWLSDIHRRLRRFDSQAAALTVCYSGSEPDSGTARKRFDALAKRLGALALGTCVPHRSDHRDMLLDHGLAMDAIETTANWAKLPRVYAAMRANLDRAMRSGAPRSGAHGLVLAQVSDASHEGAKLRLSMIFPRMLGNDVAQAEAVREVALEALAELTGPDEPLDEKLRLGIKQMLDPKAILNPGARTI
jgi:alkyldihydroxyacetonephosphate synthase